MTMMTTSYFLALSGKKIHTEQSFDEKEGLYPLQALIQPISLRFKYHFEGSRQTNKLDKVLFYME
jgi:RAD50-interacting protein 1